MILPVELEQLRGVKKIAVAGRPRVGKTTLAKALSEKFDLPLVSTDDFIDKFTFEEAKLKLLDLVKGMDKYVVEGVQVCRMLRAGHETKSWKPDALVIVESNIAPEPKHKSMASLNRSRLDEYQMKVRDVRIFNIRNDLRGAV